MKNKFSIALSLAVILSMLLTSFALADTLVADADVVDVTVQSSKNLGTVAPGATITTNIGFLLQCAGNNHVEDGQTLSLAYSANQSTIPGGSLSATPTTIGAVPVTWPDDANSVTNCPSTPPTLGDNQDSIVTIVAPINPGTYTYDVKYSISFTPSQQDDPSDIKGSAPTARLILTVQGDTTAPAIQLPSDITAEATSSAGAVVTFTATATDANPANPAVTCTPAPGSTFPFGTTTVSCSATDAAGNIGSGSFTVTVQDTTPPVVTVPADITAEATGPTGAVVTFSASASDLVDGAITPTCVPASGSTFPLGPTSVSCSATDAHGNTDSAGFTVTVEDTTPPALTVPADITAEASGPAGAVVTFAASATDIVDGSITPTCIPASGSTFALGTVAVTCSATDAHDNTGSESFNVTVQDTTAPALTVPANMVVPATSPSGAIVSFVASATDLVDTAPVVACVPPSGSTFPIGTTTVNCTATDFSGNTSSKSFTVSVRYQLFGFYQPVDMNGIWNTVKGGSTVPFKFEVFAGRTELTDTAVVSSFVAAPAACPTNGFTADPIEFTTTGQTSLRYDTVAGQFINNWQTPKNAGACYKVTMTTQDGSTLVANFILK